MSVCSEQQDLHDFSFNNCPSDDGSSILSELSEDLDDIPSFETE
jgi:hypothetical protein